MKGINSLSDLMIKELSDLLSTEGQMAEVLPKMAQASASLALKAAFEEYLNITGEHAGRLRGIFSNIGQNPHQVLRRTMKGLISEIKDAINKTERSLTLDAAITSIAQRMGAYEIKRYKTAREHAADLGHTKIVEVFTKTLNEQRAINFCLNELAQEMINIQATGSAVA